ncbi:uncharacterized acetyltransferase At3g50280-like isoform X2 [Phoenix dactylifera]|uniref:Uncharacterized acetyltransferase At3g50280-like isoform X2 n=1 Tax=Phoenix dactylifera TaxID=42345 RepID=A0A8B9AP66_PHODC|nr:uncharacterized acetyltransferase At3g50280-like isoform X2 [Phoenix dactylifera]XP_038985109.1 uncharacterized acetyltransferase At3g50280-like isoform X2 [Phoenix dactylifera]
MLFIWSTRGQDVEKTVDKKPHSENCGGGWHFRLANAMPSPPHPVHHLSTCTVKPPPLPPKRFHLTPWDLAMFSCHYIQKGLLFANLPPSLSTDQIIDRLKSSLSTALLHFYPLAGRFVTEEARDENQKVTGIFWSIDCNGEGAEFIHAIAREVTVSDVLSPSDDVPSFVQSFFPLDGAVDHDGHAQPLLAVQLTELADGIFIGCSFNHAVGDGTSYWNFFNAWAQITRTKGVAALSRPPVYDRWFIDGYDNPPVKLPFSHPDDFIERFSPPPLREKIVHFSAQSIAQLKARANQARGTNSISSFQALSALVWRSITRTRNLPADQKTSCRMAAQNRARLSPPLSPDYFGNSMYPIIATTTVGELLNHDLGWAAWLLNRTVAEHDDSAIRDKLRAWMARPVVYRLSMFDRFSVMMGSSPRFDVYGCEFGWGKAVAARSGSANKFDGKVTSYSGWEGGGSVDLEICLVPESMSVLESDEEFRSAVCPPLELGVLLQGTNQYP